MPHPPCTTTVRWQELHFSRGLSDTLKPGPKHAVSPLHDDGAFAALTLFVIHVRNCTGTVRNVYEHSPRASEGRLLPLDQRLASETSLDDAERTRCEAFLRRCFTLDPVERPAAVDLLTDPWLAPSSL